MRDVQEAYDSKLAVRVTFFSSLRATVFKLNKTRLLSFIY